MLSWIDLLFLLLLLLVLLLLLTFSRVVVRALVLLIVLLLSLRLRLRLILPTGITTRFNIDGPVRAEPIDQLILHLLLRQRHRALNLEVALELLHDLLATDIGQSVI